jgi:hypothetical protein
MPRDIRTLKSMSKGLFLSGAYHHGNEVCELQILFIGGSEVYMELLGIW